MAELTYPIPEQPEYNLEIRQLRDSDPTSATQILNPLLKQLIENTHAVKKQADQLETDTGTLEAEKGAAGGIATLGGDGKVPLSQLPPLDYDSAGSAEAVRTELTAHVGNQENPHAVTVEQIGAIPMSLKGAKEGVAELGSDGLVPSDQLPPLNYDPKGSAAAVQASLDEHTANTGNPHNVTVAQIGAISTAQKGIAGGVATLGADRLVPSNQLPPLDYDTIGSADAVQKNLTAHESNTSNPHKVTKALVGLGNVDNTSDLAKPVSTATQNAINAAVLSGSSAQNTANTALSRATSGWAAANNAQANAVTAQNMATAAQTAAANAHSNAIAAQNTAASAWAAANNAQTTADAAQNAATAAQTTASAAQIKANAALPLAGGNMTGRLTALAQATYTTKMVRNVIMRPSASTTGIESGDILHVYI